MLPGQKRLSAPQADFTGPQGFRLSSTSDSSGLSPLPLPPHMVKTPLTLELPGISLSHFPTPSKLLLKPVLRKGFLFGHLHLCMNKHQINNLISLRTICILSLSL